MPDFVISDPHMRRLTKAWILRYKVEPPPPDLELIVDLVRVCAKRLRQTKAVARAIRVIQESSSLPGLGREVARLAHRAEVLAVPVRRDIEPDAFLLKPDPVDETYTLVPVRRTSSGLWYLPSPGGRGGGHGRVERGQLFLLRGAVPDLERPILPETRLRVPISSPLLTHLVDGTQLPVRLIDEPAL